MKVALNLLIQFTLYFSAFGESYFFEPVKEPSAEKIEDDKLHLILPIRKIEPPEASSIIGFHLGLGKGREYKIQINLITSPEKDWLPMLKLGDDILLDGISVSWPTDAKFASSFSIESDDPAKIKLWCRLLGELLKVPKDAVQLHLAKEDAS